MPKRLDDLNNTRHESYIDFMRAVNDAGFTNDLDNARVSKTLSEKINEVLSKVERKGSYYITSALRPHPAHKSELVVTLHSDISPDVKVDIVLFVRPERDSLAIGRDVIGEEFSQTPCDIPFGGTLVDSIQATELFLANKRFNKDAFAAFQGVLNGLSLANSGVKILIRMTPTATGLDVKFTYEGKKLARMLFEYSL
jgi:hypothetical protein